MMRWNRIFTGWIAMLCVVGFTLTANAAVVGVTTTTDENNGILGGGSGVSLREAVLHSAAGDQVMVPFGTYVLTGGQIGLTHDVTILGPAGALAIIDCNNLSRAFVVPAGRTLVIANIQIQFGRTPGFSSGGAIENSGLLNVSNCSFNNNFATADGGAIVNDGTLVIHQSYFGKNHADYDGGAVRNNAGVCEITNSTFYGGTTGFSGAALRNVAGTPMAVRNCTISGNAANFNGGGFEGDVQLRNSIVYGNTANNAGPDIFGGFTSLGFNLVGNPAGAAGFIGTDLVGPNPMLGAPANNGGATLTMAIPAGSPALNAVAPANCVVVVDQRGVPRPQGPACDIGAFELEGATPASRPSWGRVKSLYR